MPEMQGVITGADDGYDAFEAFNLAMGAQGDHSPYAELAELREQGPVQAGAPWMGVPAEDGEPTLFTAYSYDAVNSVLSDAASFSSTGYAELMGPVLGRSILEMDPPEHRAYRSILQQAFTRKEMERWRRELVGPVVDDMLDGFAGAGGAGGGRAELVRELLFPFPVRVIAALLGLPEADLPEFHRLAVELIGVTADWDRAVAASASLRAYLADVLADRRRRPAEDMISVLAEADHDGRRLTDEEIFAFCRLLLPAGAETTYRSSSNLLFGLLTHPDQLAAVARDRSLLPVAVEEALRWEPPLLSIFRTATRDLELAGVTVPAGASIAAHIGSANHDSSRWPDPERFDVRRERKAHIAFASGPHTCLGLHLARMETAVAVGRVLDRLPNLRLDPDASAPFVTGTIFRAPPRLDVIWG
jgi:cytochrome P450